MKVIADNEDIAKIETEVTELCDTLDIEIKEDNEGREGSSDSGPKTG